MSEKQPKTFIVLSDQVEVAPTEIAQSGAWEMPLTFSSWDEVTEFVSELQGHATKLWGPNHAENDE